MTWRLSLPLLLLFCTWASSGCQNGTPENTVIDAPGTYLSPHGTWSVAVTQAGGAMRYRLVNPNGGGVELDEPYRARWFLCWDQTDRLWVYTEDGECGIGCWNTSGKGDSGGEHYRFHQVPQRVIDEMPPAFLAAVPESVKKDWPGR